jgi:HlyD family secretion protein
MKKKTAGTLIAVLLIATAGFGGWWYFLRPATATDGPAAGDAAGDTIMTVESTEGNVRVTVDGPGSVLPYRAVTVRSGVGGVVTAAPETGDRVAAGQVVVRFDTSDLAAAIRQGQLNVTQAELNDERARVALEQAEAELAKTERLAESGATTREAVEQARAGVANAAFALRATSLAVEQARLALEGAQDNLEKATVTAPFSGVVLESGVTAGDMVGSAASLFVLADLSRVRVEAEVDEYDIGRVAPGMNVVVTGDALGDESRSSRVERISPSAVVVNNIPIFTVTAVVDNSDGRLRPGMNTDLTIMISSDKGIVVPSKALSTVRSRSYVDVHADGEVVTRRVTAGADDGVSVVILEGLDAGELVVLPTASTLSLTSGTTTVAGSSIIPINVPGTGGSR